MKKTNFGIPFDIDENTFDLRFFEGIEPKEIKVKFVEEMVPLLYNTHGMTHKKQVAYKFYANVFTEDHENVFCKFGYTNGITVIMPQRVNNECLKNSGHYHVIPEGHCVPFTECYEILEGRAVFLLQKSTNFTNESEKLEIDDSVAVIMESGEKIIVPPFYAHCAVNIGDGPMLFGNLAAPCPLDYKPIEKHSGFFSYVLKVDKQLIFIQNAKYKNLPKIKFIRPKESAKHGIVFSKSLNESFMEDPEIFRYLDHPEEYCKELEELIGVEQ